MRRSGIGGGGGVVVVGSGAEEVGDLAIVERGVPMIEIGASGASPGGE